MKKIAKFYKEHRIFMILMAIVIVCIVLIATVLIQCFYVGNGSNKYGNRLENIENYKIDDIRVNESESKLLTNEKVNGAEIKITGRIIYVDLSFAEGVGLVEAQSIALKLLEDFSEEESKYYDFNFTLKQKATEQSDGFLISGAKNKNGNGLVWNNNREITKEDTSEKE